MAFAFSASHPADAFARPGSSHPGPGQASRTAPADDVAATIADLWGMGRALGRSFGVATVVAIANRLAHGEEADDLMHHLAVTGEELRRTGASDVQVRAMQAAALEEFRAVMDAAGQASRRLGLAFAAAAGTG